MSTTTRNPGVLPPGIAAAIAPSAPAVLDASLPAWNAAKAVFDACRAEEVAYDQAVWMPAYNASDSKGRQIPDHRDAEMERLMDARGDAEDALMVTAAPDLTAVIWKMEYANKRWEDFCGWPDDWWNAVINDLRRFAGGVA
jgi:hypothetical protein